MEQKTVAHTWLPKIYSIFFSRWLSKDKDFSLQNDGISVRMTEGWCACNNPAPYFKHATWLHQIYWTPIFLKPGSAPVGLSQSKTFIIIIMNQGLRSVSAKHAWKAIASMHVCHLDSVIRRWFLVLLYHGYMFGLVPNSWWILRPIYQNEFAEVIDHCWCVPLFSLSRRSLLYGVQLLSMARL